MERIFRAVLSFIFILLCFGAQGPEALAQEGKSFLWRVQNGRTTAYLLGSIHVLKKESHWLNPRIEQAFEESDNLIVEVDIGDPRKMDLEAFAGRALYPEKDSLKAHLSPRTYELVKKEAQKMGLPLEVVDKIKPWLLTLVFSGRELKKSGLQLEYGVDYYFLKRAKHKRVLELESLDFQVELLSSFSEKEQEVSLLYVLQESKNAAREFDRIFKAWRSGDVKAMESMIMAWSKEDSGSEKALNKFLYDRNRNMAYHVDFYLNTNGTHFVVAGAAHFVGNKGIIELLKEKGYRVQQF